MKIPKYIKIAGNVIKIKVDHAYCLAEGIHGLSDPEKNEIILDDYKKVGYPKEKNFQVLLHEIVHMCNATLGLNAAKFDGEQYVESLSQLLAQVLPQLEG